MEQQRVVKILLGYSGSMESLYLLFNNIEGN